MVATKNCHVMCNVLKDLPLSDQVLMPYHCFKNCLYVYFTWWYYLLKIISWIKSRISGSHKQNCNDWIHDVFTSQVSLEDKLNAISLAQTQSGSGKTEQPNLNSMVTLLTQALQSQDKNLLLVSQTRTSERDILTTNNVNTYIEEQQYSILLQTPSQHLILLLWYWSNFWPLNEDTLPPRFFPACILFHIIGVKKLTGENYRKASYPSLIV